MAGYYNYSMSNNAVAAYEMGKMPISRWTKKSILEAAAEYTDDEAKLALLRKIPLATLKRHILRYSEWHHTSSRYNTTDFYSLDEFALDDLTEDTIAIWLQETNKPTVKATPTRKLGTIEYLVWGGTRRHPKAYERKLENVEIEEKGCFYLVYQNGTQVLKKKIGSNGTFVKYTK